MRVYIEMADGSMRPWHGSLKDLEERIYNLEHRGYSVKILVL